MPRNVRNFWVSGTIDGRRTAIAGGPKSPTGGMHLMIHVRQRGEIVHNVLNVQGVVKNENTLALRVMSKNGAICQEFTFRR